MLSFRVYPKQHVMIVLEHICILYLAVALTVSINEVKQKKNKPIFNPKPFH